MSAKYPILLCTICLFLIGAAAQSGELGAGLKARLESASSDEPIKVWITLPQTDRGRGLKSMALSANRAERHRTMVETLRSEHSRSQADLVRNLEQLQNSGRASDLRQYWIANVVEATVAPDEIEALALRSDVARVQLLPEIYSIGADFDDVQPSPAGANAAESNLTYINAHQAWEDGYTGAGRIVCSFDTGVEGGHDALKNNWKGLGADSSAAWFDPVFDQPSPHTQIYSPTHGTHVMGIMVGHNDTTGDTTGVAPDAKWISACAIDLNTWGASALLRSFEWAADPDGNPNTVDDLPDVINHSWGFNRVNYNDWGIYCEDIFFEAIDNIEALGIVNIFAAGNSGSTAASIANPANNDRDSIDCFAVGNVNQTTNTIVSSSSRGPSDCNGAIKPNVMSPGYLIRSTTQGTNGYGLMTGTSMAAPHVSGLVALLRQKNPNATVDEIKIAILSSVVSHPNFGLLPNNDFGWGRIDCMAALNALGSATDTTNIRLYDFVTPAISPGDTVDGRVYLQCLGAPINTVTGIVTSTNPAVEILQGDLTFGDLSTGQIAQSAEMVTAVISDTITAGQIVGVDLVINGLGYSKATRLHFVVEPALAKSVITHNTGRIQFGVSNFGTYGLGAGSMIAGSAAGFKWNDRPSDLYEGGLMIGRSYSEVSDGVHRYVMEAEQDFRPIAGGSLEFSSPGPATFEQTHSIFDDSGATYPLGLIIEQNTFADSGINSDFIIMQYILTNRSGDSLTDVHVGLYMDWDPNDVWNQSVGGYETTEQLLWMAHWYLSSPTQYRGMKIVQGTPATALTEKGANLSYIAASGGDGFLSFEKYEALTAGFGSADTYRTTYGDLFSVIAAGPITLANGESDTVAIAILAGDTFADIKGAADRAVSVPVSVETPNISALPMTFVMHQNYPNPFNPTTTIRLEFPRRAEYRLSIYNVMGQVVHSRTAQADAGVHDIKWNGSDLASGVYFYEVEVGGQKKQRKMLLLK